MLNLTSEKKSASQELSSTNSSLYNHYKELQTVFSVQEFLQKRKKIVA